MQDANLSSGQVGWYEKGTRLTLMCSTHGQEVQGRSGVNVSNGGWDSLWYRTSDNSFVADADLETATPGAAAPDCGTPTPTVAPAAVSLPGSGRTRGSTLDSNPFTGDYVGYCTYGTQEMVKRNAGFYVNLTRDAMFWADDARTRGWTVVGEAQPHSIVVFQPSLVGGVGHVAWVDAVDYRGDGRYIAITEMNFGDGATPENGYRTTGFNQFHNRVTRDVPGMSYILIP